MNIDSRRTSYNWNVITVTLEGATITTDIGPKYAQEFKQQLEDVICDLDGLINENSFNQEE